MTLMMLVLCELYLSHTNVTFIYNFPLVQRLPWSCDFETNECGMVQPTDDRFDWLRQSVSTPTVATGPDQAQQGNYFIYAEASDPRVPGDTAL